MTRTIHVVGAAIFNGSTCLAAQRSASMSNPLKWEFPGGKLEQGESPREALVREINEELGIAITVGAFLARGQGQSRRGDIILLDVYIAAMVDPGASLMLAEHADADWFAPEALAALDWDDADRPALREVLCLLQHAQDADQGRR